MRIVCGSYRPSPIFRGLMLAVWLAPVGLAAQSVRDAAPAPELAMLLGEARAALTVAQLAAATDSINRHIEQAIVAGRRAVRLAPSEAEAHYWLAAALGRRAQRAGVRAAIRDGSEAYNEARTILALDSLHAGSHAILGRFHEEAVRWPWVVRALVASFTGHREVGQASKQIAEQEYRRAVALAPGVLLFRHDLGRFLVNTERLNDAESQWQAMRALPGSDPVDQWFRHDLRRRIDAAARPAR